MKSPQIILFFSIASVIFFFIYYYFYRRFLKPSFLDGVARKSTNVLLFIAVYSTFVMFLFLRFRVKLPDGILWTAYLMPGFLFTLFPLSIARDFITVFYHFRGIGAKVRDWFNRKLRKQKEDAAEEPGAIMRRDFLIKTNFALLGASTLMVGYGFAEALQPPLIYKKKIQIPDLPDYFEGFKIVQISDVHLGLLIDGTYLAAVVNQINELKPDVIAITGDLVDGSVSQLKQDISPLMDLVATRGKYFVTGNHEYYSGVDEWMDELERLGIKVLLNHHDIIYNGAMGSRGKKTDRNLIIAGVPDHREGRKVGHMYNPLAAIQGAKVDDVKILLAHQPVAVQQSLDAGYHLQLSGHTHGGQFFPWNMFVGIIYPYSAGLYNVENKMWVYVNRGTGYWGPPLRLGVPSEISYISLTRGV